MKRLLVAALFAAQAATAGAACSLRSLVGVSFGTYDPFSKIDDDSTGSFNVRCTPSTDPYTVKLSAGTGGRFSPRTLVSGTNTLNYNLYLDAARTQIWGDGTGGTSFLSDRGRKTFTVYGRIPAGQDPTVGSYSDSVVLLLEF